MHSSWDWAVGGHAVHFVHLNLYPGSAGGDWWGGQPEYSLEYMVQDLRRNVGSSGAPVVVISHYGPNCLGRWSDAEMQAFRAAAAPYNVIAYVHGHTHVAHFYRWKGLDVFNAPAAQPNPPGVVPGFLVFEISASTQQLRAVEHTPTGWGPQRLVKNISFAGPPPVQDSAPDTPLFPPGFRVEEYGVGY